MISLRPLQSGDIPVIRAWPPYPPAFAMLDYALREGGWLDEYGGKEGTGILAAEDGKDIIGFSILAKNPDGSAEFRIALHPEMIGRGLGKELALMTIRHGFRDSSLREIRLIVRKNNPRAQRLYESLGFDLRGECTEVVHGELVAFRRMVLGRPLVEGAQER
jgi:diamine N-acetyltransferase